MKKIKISIDGVSCETHEGESVLQVAIRNNIDIPHFCYHEDLEIEANCRTCLVETTDKKIHTSCTLKATKGLKVSSKTKEVKKLRKENMELLFAEHKKNCPKCAWGDKCEVADKMKEYGVTGKKYERDHPPQKIHKMSTAIEFDPKLCIACNQCVKACDDCGVGYLKLNGNDSKTRIDYKKDPKIDCIYCGQCTVHCPVGAIREQSQIEQVEKVLGNRNKIVIVQTAPSVRVTIGEEFGLPVGTDVTGRLFTAYRKLGFDKVFDVNMGADITTITEANELVERIVEGGKLPMFTACCPAWVKYLEFYAPKFIPNLTTARSPQMHSGGAYKTWWAKKEGIDPKKIVVVSIMPCTSKKYESSLKKLNINGIKPVDFVLTTRELSILLKRKKIDLPKLKPSEVDREGTYSGAGLIYGASGGVMESALRTAHYFLTGKELEPIDFKPVRGVEGIKESSIKIGGKRLRLCVVSTVKNARLILDKLEKNPKTYDYIEVMACPGGCLGGGGQPLFGTKEKIKERIEGIYKMDKEMTLRRAHENRIVKEFFDYTETLSKRKRSKILHTKYKKSKKGE